MRLNNQVVSAGPTDSINDMTILKVEFDNKLGIPIQFMDMYMSDQIPNLKQTCKNPSYYPENFCEVCNGDRTKYLDADSTC